MRDDDFLVDVRESWSCHQWTIISLGLGEVVQQRESNGTPLKLQVSQLERGSNKRGRMYLVAGHARGGPLVVGGKL